MPGTPPGAAFPGRDHGCCWAPPPPPLLPPYCAIELVQSVFTCPAREEGRETGRKRLDREGTFSLRFYFSNFPISHKKKGRLARSLAGAGLGSGRLDAHRFALGLRLRQRLRQPPLLRPRLRPRLLLGCAALPSHHFSAAFAARPSTDSTSGQVATRIASYCDRPDQWPVIHVCHRCERLRAAVSVLARVHIRTFASWSTPTTSKQLPVMPAIPAIMTRWQ